MNKNTTVDTTEIETYPLDRHGDDTWCFEVYYKGVHFEVHHSFFCTDCSFLPICKQKKNHICTKQFEELADTIQTYIIDVIKEYI